MEMSDIRKPDLRKQWDHLYVDDDGVIRDSHIENLYDDLFDGSKLDGITYQNMCIYTKMIFPDIEEPTKEILTNSEVAMAWVLQFGFITLWYVDEEDREELGVENSIEYVFGAKLGGFEQGSSVCGKTAHLASLLAVVQVFRELCDRINNEIPEDAAKH